MWDKYALGCIVAEHDLEKDAYLKVKDSRVAHGVIKKHVESKETCKFIFEFLDKVVLRHDVNEEPSYEELEELIKKMKFKPLK